MENLLKVNNLFSLNKKNTNISKNLSSWFAEFYELPMNEAYVLYECRDGKSMTDSPYAIFKYLLDHKEYSQFTHIWVYDKKVEEDWNPDMEKYLNQKVIFVERNTKKYVEYLATSKYLINNSTFQSFFIPKDDQICINTWHGIPLKKMGYEIEKGNPAGLQNVVRNFFFSDYLISPNEHTTNMYLKSFKLDGAYTGEILEYGYPRIDLTIEADDVKLKKSFEEKLSSFEMNKKNILYCPTWKGNNVNSPSNQIIQIVKETEYLRNQVGGSYNILVKVHPFIYDIASECEELLPYLVPDSQDPNELMAMIDLLVTDYSSIFFDFLITNKPIIFYCWDKDIYELERGIYFKDEELPGPVVQTIKEVAELILDIDNIKNQFEGNYLKSKSRFLPYEDGNSTQRAVERIFQNEKRNKGNIVKEKTRKKSLLFYVGGMKNNGITSSLINLLNNLDYSKFDVTCFTGYPTSKESITNIQNVTSKVRFIYKPGYALLNKNEEKRLLLYNKNYNSDFLPRNGLEREANRVFSNRKFDIAIDFSGYSFFWSKYILFSSATKKMCFLHSDMMADKDREVNGRKIHEKNLTPLFHVYNEFDKLITVSPIMKEVNQEKLKNYAIPEKISFSLNTLDLIKLFDGKTEKRKIEAPFLDCNLFLEPIKTNNEYSLYSSLNCLNVDSFSVLETDIIRAVAVTRADDEEKFFKILKNDLYVGWVSSSEFAEKPLSITDIQIVNYFGYIKKVRKRVIWVEPPVTTDSKMVDWLWDYKYIMVEVRKEALLSNNQVYLEIWFRNEFFGWIEKNSLAQAKNFLLIRNLKNRVSNHLSYRRWKERITETIIESGYLEVIGEPVDEKWIKSEKLQETVKQQNIELKDLVVSYSKKVKTKFGWYYDISYKQNYLGLIAEKNVRLINSQKLIYTEKIKAKIEVKLNSKIYSSIFFEKQEEALVKNYNVFETIYTTKAVFYKTTEGLYINVEDAEVIEYFGKFDLSGNFVLYPQKENYNIITMGRLSPEKRQEDLIKAFSISVKRNENLRLFILGDGPMRKSLLELVQNLALMDKVFLFGHEENPFEILKKCQLFVLTSAYEGQPMVLLEAMAVGVPVAATKIPATKYVLEDGKKGLLADDNSIEGIAQLITKSYTEKLKPANFDATIYNEKAIEMFYNIIENED